MFTLPKTIFEETVLASVISRSNNIIDVGDYIVIVAVVK